MLCQRYRANSLSDLSDPAHLSPQGSSTTPIPSASSGEHPSCRVQIDAFMSANVVGFALGFYFIFFV
jgi:hypothetical protein